MPGKGETYEALLSQSDEDESSTDLFHDESRRVHKARPKRAALWCLLVVLFLSNSIWAGVFYLRQAHDVATQTSEIRDGEYELHTTFHWNTSFSDDNKTVSSPLWAGLFPKGAGLVTVDKRWARESRLPSSQENPTDAGSMVYFVAGFHQLHCLTVIRAALYHFRGNAEQTVPWMHVTHCLDSLRQLVQCTADDVLLYTEDANVFGDGQVHTCRDWDLLSRWAAEHAFEQEL